VASRLAANNEPSSRPGRGSGSCLGFANKVEVDH
jgi:hypothetical protein